EEHPLQVRVGVPFANAEPNSGRVAARDDPTEESGRDLVPDEELHESWVSLDPGHLHLEPGDDLLRPKDVEPLCDVRADPVATDEELARERLGFPVLVEDDLDAAV